MQPTHVDDGEALYRAVRVSKDEYVIAANGQVIITARAFTDPDRKPSVDRSSIRTDPSETKFSPSDGVTKLMVHEVRAIGHIRTEPDKKDSTKVYTVDAVHRPRLASETEPRENLAHCQVECMPHIKPTHFDKRLREALANIATQHGLVVLPAE